MEKIEKKIDKIMRIWENYIFKYKFFQNQTIFSDAVKSNYFADIIVYLLDTLPLIFTYLYKKNSEKFHERILYTIGLLQTIYVHQDLIDEMLRIFKLNESSRKDKNPNREIRNEFVGHPINYKNNEDKKKVFSSSIFIKEDTDINTIHYLKYGRENDFSQENIIYSTEED